ncbi:hypothetical protein FB451DRAFT_1251485 [Mycena latifolia]|nr:hypothetical protein FB451DRAFT_1251485 [Mycena latifolia]
MQCILELVIFGLLVILARVWLKNTSERAILEDEVAYQEREITQLEKLVKQGRRYAEREVNRLHVVVNRRQEAISLRTAQIEHNQAALRDAGELQQQTENEIDALLAEVEEKNIYIKQLTERYNTASEERQVAASLNWAMGREVEELQQTVRQLQNCTQRAIHQKSICEARQAAVIKALQEHIKTAARLGAEQEAKIRLLVEQVAAKEAEKEEVAGLAEELTMKSQAAYDAQRRAYKKYVQNMKTKWAAAWEWATEERRKLRAEADLKDVEGADASFVSMANLYDQEVDEDAGMGDMSICSVLENVVDLGPPIERAKLGWVPSPSKTLAGRRLVRKIALSANPPDSPFAFATNAVRFAAANVDHTKDRSAKRMKVDCAGTEYTEQ